jgi:hypothetical protein
MTAKEIDAIRLKLSKQWKEGALPEWYARKTVIRRASKYVPMHGNAGAKLRMALQQDAEVVDIPDAEITPITGEVREIGMPMRQATVKMDHDAVALEYGGEAQVKESTITGVQPIETDWRNVEGAYDPDR